MWCDCLGPSVGQLWGIFRGFTYHGLYRVEAFLTFAQTSFYLSHGVRVGLPKRSKIPSPANERRVTRLFPTGLVGDAENILIGINEGACILDPLLELFSRALSIFSRHSEKGSPCIDPGLLLAIALQYGTGVTNGGGDGRGNMHSFKTRAAVFNEVRSFGRTCLVRHRPCLLLFVALDGAGALELYRFLGYTVVIWFQIEFVPCYNFLHYHGF